MPNLELYNKVREVPQEAKKAILAGRLKGKTDINPMWRLKKLTEIYGPCGIGWKYEIVKQWTEQATETDISAFTDILLYVKCGEDNWSAPIPGTGGSTYITKENSGRLYVNDECYKMALTDAISVACKALGFGADVYFEADASKYNAPPSNNTQPAAPAPTDKINDIKKTALLEELHRVGWNVASMLTYITEKFPDSPPKNINDITEQQFAFIVRALKKKPSVGVNPNENNNA